MKEKKTEIGFVLVVAMIAAAGFMAIQAAENTMAKPGKECTMKDMQECTMKCTMNCEKNMKNISEAMASLEAADKAIDVQNTADAKKEIEKARAMLKEIHESQQKCIDKMPTVNDRCPITGNKIDMMNHPQNLTTTYKGKKVGFCCPSCPPEWQKLSDAEKEAKLEKVMFKAPAKGETMKNMPGMPAEPAATK